MQNKALIVLIFLLGGRGRALAQRAPTARAAHDAVVDSTTIKNRAAFLEFIAGQRRTLTETAEAMPADKYGFTPKVGEFANVRTFAHQVKHLSAANFILAAAALGERPPADAGDEQGPDSVVTKAQHIAYLRASYDALERAAKAIGD